MPDPMRGVCVLCFDVRVIGVSLLSVAIKVFSLTRIVVCISYAI